MKNPENDIIQYNVYTRFSKPDFLTILYVYTRFSKPDFLTIQKIKKFYNFNKSEYKGANRSGFGGM